MSCCPGHMRETEVKDLPRSHRTCRWTLPPRHSEQASHALLICTEHETGKQGQLPPQAEYSPRPIMLSAMLTNLLSFSCLSHLMRFSSCILMSFADFILLLFPEISKPAQLTKLMDTSIVRF